MQKIESLSLIFPVFKDSKTINSMITTGLRELKQNSKKFEIIIVDDGCPENSGLKAKRFIKKKKLRNIKIILHNKNLGYGKAILTGISQAKYKWIFQVDGDGQYKISDLKKFKIKIKNYDLIIGTRIEKKYNVIRKIISYTYHIILNFFFKIKDFRDLSAGSRLISKKIIKKIKLNSSSPFFGAQIVLESLRHNFKVTNININSNARKYGSGSAVSVKNILLTLNDILTYYILYKKKK